MKDLTYKHKKSIFIEDQIPFYIREQYPLFVNLLKTYYDFLDRSQNELIGVKIIDGGKNYKEPVIKLYVIDIRQNSPTYGTYILDTRPIEFAPIVKNGRIVKVSVSNFKGLKYKKEENPKLIVSDIFGSDANLEPIILFNQGNIYNTAQDVKTIRDINQENEIFKSFLYNEIIPTLPQNLYVDEKYSVEKEKFVKFIKQIYNSKGIEAVFKFIYRILYNSNVDFYYPKTDILRVSDGVWIKKYHLISDRDLTDYIGYKIVSSPDSTGQSATGIISSVSQHPTLPNRWKIEIHERTKNFETGQTIFVYDFKYTYGEELCDVLNIEEDDGYFENDRGFLSSQKKIQDDYYYQEFSYELQSEYNIKEFYQVLEELLHPAGFKYFIKILVEILIDETYWNPYAFLIYNNVRYPDIEIVSGEEAGINKKLLRMTLRDLYFSPIGDFKLFTDIINMIATVTPNTNTNWINNVYSINSSYNKNHLLENNTMYGYTAYFTSGSTTVYSPIIKSTNDSPSGGDPPNSIQINQTFNISDTDINLTIYPGYLIQSVSSNVIGLSPFDPFYFATGNNTSDPEKRFLIGYSLYILNGSAKGERRKIIGYNGTAKTVTLESAITGINTNTVYRIIPDYDGTEYFGGKVTAVNVIKGGSNYTNPTFIIDSPLSGTAPTFNVTVTGGSITAITLNQQGTGFYYQQPNAIISDPTGNGCVFELVISFPENNPILDLSKSIIQGSIFEYDPKEYFKKASIRTVISNGFVTSVSIEDKGKGYWFTPAIFQKSGDGEGAKIKITSIIDGEINNVTITSFGNDYTYEPEFVFDPVFSLHTPTIGMLFKTLNSSYYGKLLCISDNKNYVISMPSFNLLEKNTENIQFQDININVEGTINYFSTKNLQCKHTYPTEIEVIR